MPFAFGNFELDPEGYRLLRSGREVTIEPRALDLLCYLAAHPNRLVSKDELLAAVWKLEALSEGVLSNTVGKLRQALGQDAKASEPIETVRGRGYRFRSPTAPSAAQPNQQGELYVGRGSVLATLTRCIADSALGAGQLVLITGEPGIGKTRTLDELAQRAAAHSFKVYRGAAYDGAGAPAYWPWIEVLREAHAALGDASFRALLPAAASALPVLVPELLGGEAALEAERRALRFALFDELARFLSAASQHAPCLICLDDLQWADAATLELLAYVARALSKRPVLFAVGMRAHELAASAAHAPLLQRLDRSAARIELTGLAEAELPQLVAALPSAFALDARVHAALHRRTHGNPFFVRQIMALFAERSLVPDAASVESVELPAALQSVLQQRLSELDALTQRALAAASVLGAEVEASSLAELLELSLDDTLRALESALRAGVIERQAGPVQRFAFVHTLLREVLYNGLSLSAAGALHANAARALQARARQRDARQLGEIARHALRALPCELASCLEHCRLAADAARQTSGFEVAAELLSLALDKCTAEGGDPGTACDLLLELAFDQLCANDVFAAARTLDRGASLAMKLDRADLLAGFACRMIDWLEFSGDETSARIRFDQALAKVPESDLRSRVALLGRAPRMRPELARHALFAEAEALAAQLAEPAVWLDLAFCRATLRDPNEVQSIQAVIAHCHALRQRYPTAHAGIRDDMRSIGVGLTEYLAALTLGDFPRAELTLARARAAAAHYQVPAINTVLDLFSAGRMLASGRLDELEADIQRRLEGLSETPSTSPERGWMLYAWLLAHARGQLAQWAGIELDIASMLQALPNEKQQWMLRVWTAWFYAHTGRHGQAQDTLRWFTPQLLASKPMQYGDLGLLCQVVDTLCTIKQSELAPVLHAQLAPHAQCHAIGTLGESWGTVAQHLKQLERLLAS